MRIHFVGADFEENLGLGLLTATAAQAGHEARIVPFNRPDQMDKVVSRIIALDPDVVGLSIQFQHRAHEFLRVARALRTAGYRGHITSGGQFPSLAFEQVLNEGDVDSVAFYDGEHTLVALLDALERRQPLGDVPGLALRTNDGVVFRTPERRLVEDLDALPFATRYREHDRHMNVPFIPIMASRGCWGKCSYCSIVSFFKEARENGGGRTFRLRTPENIAAEMALLAHRAGEPAIFCFHDDNFSMPRPEDTLTRVRAIREELDSLGVGQIGIVGKVRPETVNAELAEELADLGVIRLYVGVENASDAGGEHLRRGIQTRAVPAALKACRDAGIFVCYNLLVFEPHATIQEVRENVAFIRENAAHPVNFCRAEPYFGTPLHLELSQSQELGGSYLGWNYRMDDDRAELLFRVCAAAFRERNFATRGVANRYMGLGYAAKILERFHSDHKGAERLGRQAINLTRAISLDTADHLEAAIKFVENVELGDFDTIERETVLLGLSIAEADREWHIELDELYKDLREFSENEEMPKSAPTVTPKLLSVAKNFTLGASMAVAATACDCGTTVDPVPHDAARDTMVVDPPPMDAGMDADGAIDGGDSGLDSMVVDPPPPDAARDIMVVDPPPVDAAMDGNAFNMADDNQQPRRVLPLIDQWRDSAPKRTVRTADLPLYQPPQIALQGTDEGDRIRVAVSGLRGPHSLRWRSNGQVIGEGTEVEWFPASEHDQIRCAIRTKGGVAIVSLRGQDLA